MKLQFSKPPALLAASLSFSVLCQAQFVTRNGVNFELNGQSFNYAGTNIYDGK